MTKYLVQDLRGTFEYASYGIIIGCVAYVLYFVLRSRCGKSKNKFSLWGFLFCVNLFILLAITLFSRESGGDKRVDLQVGSSWGINIRNNAYVMENILLFIPYGYLLPMVWEKSRNWWKCLLLGFGTSLLIETLQLVSGRGVFQTDDIITNTMGALLGYILFWLINTVVKVFKKDNCA